MALLEDSVKREALPAQEEHNVGGVEGAQTGTVQTLTESYEWS